MEYVRTSKELVRQVLANHTALIRDAGSACKPQNKPENSPAKGAFSQESVSSARSRCAEVPALKRIGLTSPRRI